MSPLYHHVNICRERLTSRPDRRIGQRKLDDWKPLRRFYVVVAKRGSHTIVQHRSRSTTGSSEALMSQSPRSTLSKHFTQEPLRRMTGEDQSLVSICVSSSGRVPPSGGRCCQIATESVTARPFRVTGTDQGSANVRALITIDRPEASAWMAQYEKTESTSLVCLSLSKLV